MITAGVLYTGGVEIVLPQGIWNGKLTEGDSAPKIKVEQKRKVLLLLLCGFGKNLSAHDQSVEVTES